MEQAVAAVVAAPALVGAARAARRVDTRGAWGRRRAPAWRAAGRAAKIEAPPLSDDERDTCVDKWSTSLAAARPAPIRLDRRTAQGRGQPLGYCQLVRKRDVLRQATYPAAGDILRYQARGAPFRRFIADRIDECPDDEVTVIAHSLGGIACVIYGHGRHGRESGSWSPWARRRTADRAGPRYAP